MTSPAPEKSKPPLHNFNMPWLQWGNRKLMRCMKVNESSPTSFNHRRSGEIPIGRLREPEFERRGSIKKAKRDDDGIEAVREKLMVDLKTAAFKMKNALIRDGLETPAKDTPWNLRTRRAACKEPPLGDNAGEQKPNSSPLRTEANKSARFLRGSVVGGVVGESSSGEKRDRVKFSVSLSRREIADDFMVMTGHRLPRRPKKRPKYIQKDLDTLFPGLWMTEINADLYKVPDAI